MANRQEMARRRELIQKLHAMTPAVSRPKIALMLDISLRRLYQMEEAMGIPRRPYSPRRLLTLPNDDRLIVDTPAVTAENGEME
jgi:hypothetical protein